VIAQEMMTLRAGTVFSFYGARLADAREGHRPMQGRNEFMIGWLSEFVKVRRALLVEGGNAFLRFGSVVEQLHCM
jgi:hypothetical protein